ncbi:MAG: maltose acetyltransferase domain-containing protein [Breznakia sp.]
MFYYNHTLPSEKQKRIQLLKKLLGSIDENCFFEVHYISLMAVMHILKMVYI